MFKPSRIFRKVVETIPPVDSRIQSILPGAYFYDSFKVVSKYPSKTALEQFLFAMKATPAWVDHCMTLRNKVVQYFGLKNLGTLSDLEVTRQYQIGDRIGIFTLFEQSDDEVLIGDKDKHLNVTLSFHRQPIPLEGSTSESGEQMLDVAITVTTVVHVNNWFGKLYMLPVTPMHRLIAPTVLNAIDKHA